MKIFDIKKMQGGWFIGDFVPSVLQTRDFEVAVKYHKQDEEWPKHAQSKATEYNVLIDGFIALETDSKTYSLKPGDGFIIEPKEAGKPYFLTDCTVVCVKVPSIPGDKYTCK